MKKVFLSAIMMIAFSGVSMANDIAEKQVLDADSKGIIVSNTNCRVEEGSTTITVEGSSLKCWAFKKWVRMKLNQVSDNEKLIDATVYALGDLCEIANDLDLI